MDLKNYLLKNNIPFEEKGNNLTVGGGLYLSGTNITSLPDNLTVGGYLDLRGTNITSLPDNLTVGGYLDLEGTNIKGKKQVKKLLEDFYIKYRNYIESKLTWQNGKYCKIDSIFCEVIKRKNNILTVKINNKKAYIFTKNGVNAHGRTVKQAYRDWLFKTSPRDMEEYKNLQLSDVHDQNYWAVCYRTITGACSLGTENFIENFKNKLKPKMTLQEVIDVTEGQYNSHIFKEFFEQ